jgi:hypothetical protein
VNRFDEKVRDALSDAMSRAEIDARNLSVEIENHIAFIRGTVPTAGERDRVENLLSQWREVAPGVQCDIAIVEAAPSDSPDGRGRSPFTGTSADSAHESRHQSDRK